MEKIYISAKDETLEQFKEGESFKLLYKDNLYRVVRETHKADQGNALRWMILPTIIQIIIYFIYVSIKQAGLIPLMGDSSLSNLTIILGVVGTICIFTVAFVLGKKKDLSYVENFPSRHFPALLVALTIMVLIGLLFFFYLFDKLFHGLELDKYLSSLFIGILLTVVNYAVLYFLFTMSTTSLTRLLTNVMFSGVAIAMITNADTFWWKRHLSFLGSSKAVESWQFNLTLILSGLLMVALVDSIFITISKEYPNNKGIKYLRIFLYLTGICLSFVGVFPFDGPRAQPFLHHLSAELMVIVTIFMMLGNRKLIPNVTRDFSVVSYGLACVLGLFILLKMIGSYITLTAFEIITFLISFIWLMMMFDFLNHIAHPQANAYEIILEEINDKNK